MIIYVFLCILFITFAVLQLSKQADVLISFSCVIVVIFLFAFRGPVGHDYVSYYHYLKLASDKVTILDFFELESVIEPGYQVIMYVVSRVQSEYWLFFLNLISVSVIILFFRLRLTNREVLFGARGSYKVYIFALFFWLSLTFYSSFDLLRQCLATLVFVVLPYYFDHRKTGNLVAHLSSVLIHYSAFIFIFVVLLPNKPKVLFFISLILLLFTLIIAENTLVANVLSFSSLNKILFYLELEEGFSKFYFVPILIQLLFVVFVTPESVSEREYDLALLGSKSTMVFYVINLITNSIVLLDRFIYSLIIFSGFSLFVVIKTAIRKKNHVLVFAMICFLYMLPLYRLFNVFSVKETYQAYVPYTINWSLFN